MNERARHLKVWNALIPLIAPVFRNMFSFTYTPNHPGQPALIVSNHVTNYDPLLLAITFPKHQMYFVASEHLFRMGWISKAIIWLVAPIARRKGTTGMDTAMACVRKLRAGESVCIFGEGETTWNGVTNPIFSATGNLARISGAALITYRLEGGYLTAPRWGKGIRRGKMHGRVVRTYQPEELKKMTAQEINDAINRDIYEDTWENQKKEPVRYKGKNRADFIETSLFLCPECKRIGTVRGEGNHVRCSCGLDLTFTEYGLFDPPQPFENMAQWDTWQHECLKNGTFAQDKPLFTERDVTLMKVHPDHGKTLLAAGDLTLDDGTLRVAEYAFPLSDIPTLGVVQRKLLVFIHQGEYYEIRTKTPACMRKYYAVWQNIHEAVSLATEKTGA